MSEFLLSESEDDYLSKQLITYIGNKRKLLGFIKRGIDYAIERLQKKKLIILDGFAGSGVVSRYFKQYAEILYSNDFEYYAYIIGKCFLANKSEIDFTTLEAENLFLNENKLTSQFGEGFVRRLYSPQDDQNIKLGERVFYTNKNAKIVDNVRQLIETLPNAHQYFHLGPLLSEVSRKVNTSGTFKGFHKNPKTGVGQFGGGKKDALTRILGEIEIKLPVLSEYECDIEVFQEDINNLILRLDSCDVVYYDPPYNQHQYGGFYHMLNAIAKYEEPQEISEVSGIPKEKQNSDYCKAQKAKEAFEHLIANTPAKFILISYNNEGIIPQKEMVAILKKYGELKIFEQQYNTFKGSRNLKNRNKSVTEILYVLEKN